jgi:foldase protein PrsA
MLLIGCLLFLVGAVSGGWIIRQRHRATQVVASVNGAIITDRDLFHRLEVSAGRQMMRQLVAEELRLQFARKQGIGLSEPEVEARLGALRKSPNYAKNLASSGQTEEDIKRSIRLEMAQVAVTGKGVKVTEEEMKRFYQANTDKNNPRARFYTPEAIRVAVIVTRSEQQSKQALSLMNKGSAFDKVAREYSVDPSKKQGGALPVILRGRTKLAQVRGGMEDAIFRLKIGEQLGPKKFVDSWWIIHCVDKTLPVIKRFPDVQEECRAGILLQKGMPLNARTVEKEFEAFQNAARIQAFQPKYREAIKP